ncbi:uncharacterized protein LOC133872568 [Alnus glutinosa]|uniref:uncharacterized protein LOC133872568 n=1 Tax=Alnus glutinosa TaxID=3517 RepID=UPI002D7A36CF|nr:uncharacterized protein LOC133872568 [Alnus glutinosa]
MAEGTLPVRYLGVPLISKRLSKADCEGLVAKFTSRMDSWCAKHLSFAANWIKGCSFWHLSTPQPASCSWKQILKLREIAKEFLSFKVGDGQSIFLWLDNWHPNGYLLGKYGHRVVHDAGSTIGNKLSTVIRDGEWCWPPARSKNLVELQSRLLEVSLGGTDVLVWKNGIGKYNCVDTWNALREKEPRVDCKRIWRGLMELCLVENPVEDWDDIRAWSGTVLRRDCFKTTLCILCLGAATHHIWKQRNAILHLNNILTEEAIIGRIKWEFKAQMLAKGNFQRSMENSRLAHL